VKIQREPLSRPPYYVSQTQLQLRAARLAQRWYGGIGSGDSSTPENEGVSFEKPKKKLRPQSVVPEDLNLQQVQ